MKFLSHNFGAKIFALLCAVFLWVYVSASENKIAEFPGTIFIEAENTPPGLAAIYDQQRVKIQIQTPFEAFNRLNADNFKASVDLSGLEKGTYEVDVKVTVNLPNVLIIEKEPDKIIVRLEPIKTKDVPVVVKFEGEAKPGFVPGEPEVTPNEVELSGAESIVNTISEAVAKIILSGEGEDFEKTVLVAVYNEKNEKQTGIEFEPKSIKVKVPIISASETKTVGIKVNTQGRPKSSYFVNKIEVDPATLEVSGPESSLKSILFIETKAVDINGIEKDLEKEVDLIAPSSIALKTKRVKVKITLGLNVSEREISATLLTTGTNLTVLSITPNIVKVVISGPQDIISTLTSEKVMITFDLFGKAAGTYSVNITKEMISVPSGCAPIFWLPSAVTIVLQ